MLCPDTPTLWKIFIACNVWVTSCVVPCCHYILTSTVHTANIEIRVCVKWSLTEGGRTWRFDCRWSIKTLKKGGFKHFSWCTANLQWPRCTADIREYSVIECLGYERDWIGFDHGKKHHLLRTLCRFEKEKKHPNFLPFFRILTLFSRRFTGLENCSANFKTFSGIYI